MMGSSVPPRLLNLLLQSPDAPEIEMYQWRIVPYNAHSHQRVTLTRKFATKSSEAWKHGPKIERTQTLEVVPQIVGTCAGKPFKLSFDHSELVAVLWYDEDKIPDSEFGEYQED